MKRISTKAAAEAALRELPSVLGAFVSEDDEGRPREIHLLIRPGPDPAGMARDIRGLLEDRLGIPIDQRVISIAQLEREPGAPRPERGADRNTLPGTEASARGRPRFAGLESTTASGHVQVVVRLEWQGELAEGIGDAVETRAGRARAAATATLLCATEASWTRGLTFELDLASIVEALDGEHVLVGVLALSPDFGRRPRTLVGAHPVEDDLETAAALATLKAINRVLALSLRS